MGILNSIRQKPDSQKRVISLVLALILTFFIVGFWYSFTGSSSDNKGKLSSVSPWQMIKGEFSRVFYNVDGVSGTEGTSTVPVEVIFDNEVVSTSNGTSTDENAASITSSTTDIVIENN